MTSAFLIQNELMPGKVFDASRMASRQASSNPFGDCAMTSIFRTIAIGLSSQCILPASNTSVRKRVLRRLVSSQMSRIEETPARGGGIHLRDYGSARPLPFDRHHGLVPRVAQPAPQPPFQVENFVGRLQPKTARQEARP